MVCCWICRSSWRRFDEGHSPILESSALRRGLGWTKGILLMMMMMVMCRCHFICHLCSPFPVSGDWLRWHLANPVNNPIFKLAWQRMRWYFRARYDKTRHQMANLPRVSKLSQFFQIFFLLPTFVPFFMIWWWSCESYRWTTLRLQITSIFRGFKCILISVPICHGDSI